MTVQTRLFAGEYPKRPAFNSASVTKRTAERLLPKFQEWLDGDTSGSNLADLTRALESGDLDGYDLAEKLKRKGYSPDAELVEILNEAMYQKSEAHREEVEDWVRAHDLKLDLAVGTKVEISHKGQKHFGEIGGLYEKTAQYIVTVKELGHAKNCGLILGFEEVKAVE